MTFRIIRLALGATALALTATLPVVAQSVETRGVVQRVDVPSSTVYFTDGRIARIAPGSRLTVDDRPITLADVQPGWTLVIPAAVVATAPSVVVATPPPAQSARPPVDATGVVSRVDPQNGTIVLEDGRVLQATGRTTIWQPVPIGDVKPGASVYMRNAQPLDFRPGATTPPAGSARFQGATTAPAGSVRYQMGTVRGVDGSRVMLSDGGVVDVAPGARLESNGRALTVRDLRPGDEIVISVPPDSSLTVVSDSASALPAQAYVVTTREVYVVRRPQAP
jgi:hypothetical protein